MTGAVFANSTLLHSRAQEDSSGGGSVHPGTLVIPVVLAVAENYRCTGKQVMEAVLVGYEVLSALGKVLGKLLAARGFRPNATLGGVGAAAAIAKLMGLSSDETAHALRLAVSFACGITEPFTAGTNEWMLQTAMSARNGMMAAQLASSGIKGAESAFDGNTGFMEVFVGTREQSILESIVEGLGREWNICDLAYKKYPTCAHNQTPFILTLNVVEEYNILPDQVEKVSYYMAPAEIKYPGIRYKGPFSSESQCIMSTAFNIACAIKHRALYKSYQQCYTDQELFNLIKKTTAHEDDSRQIFSGKIEITLVDGQIIKREMNVTTDYHLSWEEDVKLIRLVHKEVGIPESQTDKFVLCINDLEKASDVFSLISVIKLT